jgi:hypothetical protein
MHVAVRDPHTCFEDIDLFNVSTKRVQGFGAILSLNVMMFQGEMDLHQCIPNSVIDTGRFHIQRLKKLPQGLLIFERSIWCEVLT